MKIKLSLFFLFFLFVFSSIGSSALGSNVLIVEVTDTIDSSTVEIFKESLEQAKSENSEAIILLLDTPGGGLEQTCHQTAPVDSQPTKTVPHSDFRCA